ncbi:hypothetical protein KAX02_02770 [candidate division WOR-3 bacterium]|nr:hypothetical protein [candidate division WOR-3 bacterium]
MSIANRAIEFEALIVDGQVIAVEVQGMKFENEQRIHLGQSMAYQDDAFDIKAKKLSLIADKLRALKI